MNSEHKYPPNLAIKREREAKGWSQADLAEQITNSIIQVGEERRPISGSGLGGCSGNTVSGWESGAHWPRPHHRRHLCLVFDKSPEELGLIREGDPPTPSPPSLTLEDQGTESLDQLSNNVRIGFTSIRGRSQGLDSYEEWVYPFDSPLMESVTESSGFIWHAVDDLFANNERPTENLDDLWPTTFVTADRVLFCLTRIIDFFDVQTIKVWLNENNADAVAKRWALDYVLRTKNRLPEVLTDVDLSLLRSVSNHLGDQWWEEYEFLMTLSSRPLAEDLMCRFRHWWYQEHPSDCVFLWKGEAFNRNCLCQDEFYPLCNLHQFVATLMEAVGMLRAICIAKEQIDQKPPPRKLRRKRRDLDDQWVYILDRKRGLEACEKARARYASLAEQDPSFSVPNVLDKYIAFWKQKSH
jgi:transcriptional regulator with XRE-family HTH domain